MKLRGLGYYSICYIFWGNQIDDKEKEKLKELIEQKKDIEEIKKLLEDIKNKKNE